MKTRVWSFRRLKKARWKRAIARALKRGHRIYGGWVIIDDLSELTRCEHDSVSRGSMARDKGIQEGTIQKETEKVHGLD